MRGEGPPDGGKTVQARIIIIMIIIIIISSSSSISIAGAGRRPDRGRASLHPDEVGLLELVQDALLSGRGLVAVFIVVVLFDVCV